MFNTPDAASITISRTLSDGRILQIVGDSIVVGSTPDRIVLRDPANFDVILDTPIVPPIPDLNDPFGRSDDGQLFDAIPLANGGFALIHIRGAVAQRFDGLVIGDDALTAVTIYDAQGRLVNGAGVTVEGSFAGGLFGADGGGVFAVIPNDRPPGEAIEVEAFRVAPNGAVSGPIPATEDLVIGGGIELDDGTFLKTTGRLQFGGEEPAGLIRLSSDLQPLEGAIFDDLPGDRDPFDYTPLTIERLNDAGLFAMVIAGEVEQGPGQIQGDVLLAIGDLAAPGGANTPLRYIVLDERIAASGGQPQILELDDGGFVVTFSRIFFDASGAPASATAVIQRFDRNGEPISDLTEVGEAGGNEVFASASQLDDGTIVVTASELDTPAFTSSTVKDFVIAFSGDGGGTGGGGTGGGGGGEPQIPGELFTGTADADLLTGGVGTDTLKGLAGRDTIFGGDGDDQLRGGLDRDRLRGDDGDDELRGQGDDDRLFGQMGDDTLIGNAGEDTLKGGSGDDRLVGNGAADVLFGGIGNDRLNGSAGADRLIGGAGDDVILGGTGSDRFIFRQNVGDDTIVDFQDGVDLIRIQNGAESFADLTLTVDGADLIVAFTGTTIRLRNTDEDDVSAADFLF